MLDATQPPPLPAGAFEYRFPETVIPAHAERMTCEFMPPLTEDVYYSGITTYQGKAGHHLLLYKTMVPEPAGTIRDCSEGASMASLIPVMLPSNVGYAAFPTGMAIKVNKGSQLVWQQHYLNGGAGEIATRDVAHVTPMPASQVRQAVGFFGASTTDVTVPASPQVVKLELTCAITQDMNVVMLAPHMHEWGSHFANYLNDEKLVEVTAWDAHYRDMPPITTYPDHNPLKVKKGDVLRTHCFYRNDTGGDLRFPKEMCATMGYYFPAEKDWTCTPEPKISFVAQ